MGRAVASVIRWVGGRTGGHLEESDPKPLDPRSLLIVGFAALAQSAYVLLAPLERVTLYVNDDAYYYLLVARNWVARGFPSFDGTSLTNGFQVLWQLLILPFGFVASKAFQLRLTLVLGAVLMQIGILGFSAALGILGGRRLKLTFLWAAEAQCLIVWVFALNGMESSLQAALLGVIAYVLALESVDLVERPEVVLGVLAGLSGLNRLDGLALAPLIAAYLLARRRRGARVAVFLGIAVSPVVLVLLANTVATGFPLPVSSEVKLLPAKAFAGHWLAHMGAGVTTVAKLAFYLASRVLGGYVYFAARLLSVPDRVISYSCGGAAFVAIAIVAWRMLRRRFDHLAPLFPIAALVAVRVAFFAWAYPTTFHLFDWYWTDGLFVLMIVLVLFFASFRLAKGAAWIVGLVVALNFLGFLTNSENRAHLRPIEEATAFVRSLGLPPTEAVGSWDAGYVAFLLNRPVINLDGLVNSREYLENVLAGSEPLSKYLASRGVRYVVNWVDGRPSSLTNGFRGLRAGEYGVAFLSRAYRAPFGEIRQCAVLRLTGPSRSAGR